MGTIVERFLIPLFVIVSVLYAYNSLGNNTIEMIKVYHHTTEDIAHLERANLSFYFSRDPQVQQVKNRQSDTCTSCIFFFPHVVIKQGECEAMVKRATNYNDGYTIAIEHVIKPVQGIQLVFNIDINRFAINYERFDSIGLHKGIVFRLYDKNVLGQLERTQNNQPVLRTLRYDAGKPRIVIDPGHGGIDSGTIGCSGTQEKDVCLAISMALSDLLQSQGYDALLTRNSDSTVFLEERTAYANNGHSDLFISIHANYSVNPHACGIETFCLRQQLFSHEVLPLISGLREKYIAHYFNQKFSSSYKLAQAVHNNLCNTVSEYHNVKIDRNVKFSVAQVLLGTVCPSILVEVGFMSHAYEALLLGFKEYQNKVAYGIYQGILTAMAC